MRPRVVSGTATTVKPGVVLLMTTTVPLVKLAIHAPDGALTSCKAWMHPTRR
jgi:hypothetical protein